MISEGTRRVRAARQAVAAVFLLELGGGLIFAFAVARAFSMIYGRNPLFARGVAGDDVALSLALQLKAPALTALGASGLALLLAWKLASFYLAAGLTGALARRGFGATAAARFGGFVRLSLWSLIPYAAAAALGAAGIMLVDPRLEDLTAWDTMVGLPALGLIPGLLVWIVTSLAVDLGRARLVRDGGGSARALGSGLARAVTRPRLLGHYLLYLLVWLAISGLFVAVTAGQDFPGAGGAWLLFVLRQATAGGRFLARSLATGGQVAALEADVVELREVPERGEALADVGRVQAAQPIERESLDGE